MKEKTLDLVLLLWRLTFGGLMLLNHGWGKVERALSGSGRFPDPLGLGSELSLWLTAFAEGVCALLIVLGLFTRLATVPLIFAMGVAAFVVHGDDPFKDKELALIYLVAFVSLLLTGPGSYALDAKRNAPW